MNRYLGLGLLLLILVLSSCNRRGEGRNEILLGEDVIRATNGQGVEVLITAVRQHRRLVELGLDLHNGSSKSIRLGDLQITSPGITLSAGEYRIAGEGHGNLGPWTGYHEGAVQMVDQDLILEPEARVGLRLLFPWPAPYFERHDYPWTLTIANIYAVGSDAPMATIKHHEGPARP